VSADVELPLGANNILTVGVTSLHLTRVVALPLVVNIPLR